MTGLRIAAVRLLCPDVARTRAFYVAAFGARAEDGGGGLVLGEQRIELAAAAGPAAPPAPANSTAFQHFAVVVADMAVARRGLDAVAGWQAISRGGPQVLPASSGGVTAFKFRDPDGHPLELLQFADGGWPDDRGAPRAVYRGVDHSAITVADTDRAIAFYAGLGFSVASRQVNRGIEQQRLDDVPDAIVEVTALRPPGGVPPHLELLCYRSPGTRAESTAPDDERATRLVLRDAGPVRAAGGAEFERRDPDGHRLVFAGGAVPPY